MRGVLSGEIAKGSESTRTTPNEDGASVDHVVWRAAAIRFVQAKADRLTLGRDNVIDATEHDSDCRGSLDTTGRDPGEAPLTQEHSTFRWVPAREII